MFPAAQYGLLSSDPVLVEYLSEHEDVEDDHDDERNVGPYQDRNHVG